MGSCGHPDARSWVSAIIPMSGRCLTLRDSCSIIPWNPCSSVVIWWLLVDDGSLDSSPWPSPSSMDVSDRRRPPLLRAATLRSQLYYSFPLEAVSFKLRSSRCRHFCAPVCFLGASLKKALPFSPAVWTDFTPFFPYFLYYVFISGSFLLLVHI